MRNLFTLNSIIVPTLIASLATLDPILDKGIAQKGFTLQQKKQIAVLVINTALLCILRYKEQGEIIYTPKGLPGIDKDSEI